MEKNKVQPVIFGFAYAFAVTCLLIVVVGMVKLLWHFALWVFSINPILTISIAVLFFVFWVVGTFYAHKFNDKGT